MILKGFISYCQKRSHRFELKTTKTKAQKGQLVIEYVLLLALVTMFASQVVQLLIGQGGTPEEQGFVVRKWAAVIQTIATDLIDN